MAGNSYGGDSSSSSSRHVSGDSVVTCVHCHSRGGTAHACGDNGGFGYMSGSGWWWMVVAKVVVGVGGGDRRWW